MQIIIFYIGLSIPPLSYENIAEPAFLIQQSCTVIEFHVNIESKAGLRPALLLYQRI